MITGFTIQKIDDVAQYMLMAQDIEKAINEKLSEKQFFKLVVLEKFVNNGMIVCCIDIVNELMELVFGKE